MSDTPARKRGRPPAEIAPEQRVEAVERALSLLDAFSLEAPRLTLADLARRTGFYPSTILRLAASLERFGYLLRGADGLFRLGPATLRLGMQYQAGFDLAEHMRPALARLSAATGETAAFYVREGGDRICLFRHEALRTIRHSVPEGAVLPLDRGASGHVLRAEGGGVVLSMGERDAETASLACPVFAAAGRFLGALGVAGPMGRFSEAERARITPLLEQSAAELSRALGAARHRVA
ncbi:IclR family transcriptional regulator [Rhodovarius crocodyli]|uniref:IclR family transcriptional regulator n=1 Tax=Rhodovarius crocodyli TaxID=1979269 RepID=A0A437LYY7_9PROT|nr:IclR family transcriptional regulator [Rhodovarius crocodyli]RVT90607.1 IclR family transcriptional regulator [Rhodovarius crocodyli]